MRQVEAMRFRDKLWLGFSFFVGMLLLAGLIAFGILAGLAFQTAVLGG